MNQENVPSIADELYFQVINLEQMPNSHRVERQKMKGASISNDNLFYLYTKGKKPSSKEERFRVNLLKLFIEHWCLRGNIPLKTLMNNIERILILKALSLFGGNQKNAAKFLKINYTTLNEKIKRYNIRVKKIVS